MSDSRFLVVVVVLQGLLIVGQWLGGSGNAVGVAAPAYAQGPDPARDRLQLLEEAKATNAKLDTLIELLRSGKVEVKVIEPEESKEKAAPAR